MKYTRPATDPTVSSFSRGAAGFFRSRAFLDKPLPVARTFTRLTTVPKLEPGRVYCVERVNVVYGNQWLRLVGVREHKIKCCDDRGPMALAFRHVGPAGNEARKGGR